MNERLLAYYDDKLGTLKSKHNYRSFANINHRKRYISIDGGERLLNLASNDYMGMARDESLHDEFMQTVEHDKLPFTSSSSRLLTGNFEIFDEFEWQLQQLFGRACLLFNSGYHANVGILPALCDGRTVIIADKLVHASMIDGMRLAAQNGTKTVRYQHQNLLQLAKLLDKYQQDRGIDRIIVATESIFSMDGDVTDLAALVRLKRCHDKVMLYVDEAHAVGVRGERGLGCAEEFAVIDEIDFIVGAFGKAVASMGGYVICHKIMREFLINTMRPLIFSTALPPVCVAWTQFVFSKLIRMNHERQKLMTLSQQVAATIRRAGLPCPSASQIIPVILGDNQRTLDAAAMLQQAGFYAMAVRPPTVPQNQSRLRLCLSADLEQQELDDVLQVVAGVINAAP